MGDRNMNNPYASASSFDDLFPPCAKLPFHGVELQPSPVCPKNFVIFDQTYDRSQVMYHPELTHRLASSPSLNGLASKFQSEYVGESFGNYGQQEVSSSHQEDPNEIDALLSTDEDYEDGDDDENEDGGDSEEVSTARNSYRDYGNASAEESCCSSSYGYKSSKKKQSLSGSASCNNDGKGRKKMKKMMGVLRRIVPGGEDMNTACVLDEAVQYLKSLKIEAQKLGVGHFSNQS
ncbi:transcription factor bHLH144 isoform X2 [Eutrema salsugineum]|nr:transcription factor bHLH144 isoform X2 [Eutrema salsugineum]